MNMNKKDLVHNNFYNFRLIKNYKNLFKNFQITVFPPIKIRLEFKQCKDLEFGSALNIKQIHYNASIHSQR